MIEQLPKIGDFVFTWSVFPGLVTSISFAPYWKNTLMFLCFWVTPLDPLVHRSTNKNFTLKKLFLKNLFHCLDNYI